MARRPLIATVAVTGVLAALALGTPRSSATTLGVTSQALDAWTVAGASGAPTVIAWDGFTRAAGTNLDGQATAGAGPVWQAVAGTWTTTANTAGDAPSAPNAALVVDCGRSDLTVTAVLSGSTPFSAGLALKRVGSGYLYVVYRQQAGGRIDVGTAVGTTRSDLDSVTNVGTALPATLSATYTAGVVTVRLNGVVRLTVPLPAATVAAYGTSTQFGLYSRDDERIRWDDFRCEA